MHSAFFLTHWWEFFFAPKGAPWYTGNVWGNVVAVIPLGVGGYLWSKTKFWPLNLLHGKLDHLVEQHRLAREHRKWEAQVLHDIHLNMTGRRPASHPHHDLATGEREHR